MDLYLKFDGIEGPLAEPTNCFQGLGLKINVKRGVRSASEGGTYSYKEKADFGEVLITKYVDASSEKFPEKMLMAEIIPWVEIIMKANQVERKIILGNVRVTSINTWLEWEDKHKTTDDGIVVESRDEVIKESISLHYEKIEWNMTGADHGFAYDLLTDKKTDSAI